MDAPARFDQTNPIQKQERHRHRHGSCTCFCVTCAGVELQRSDLASLRGRVDAAHSELDSAMAVQTQTRPSVPPSVAPDVVIYGFPRP
jgi:hypothetical protein